MTTSLWYKLDEHGEAVPADDGLAGFDDPRRFVARDEVGDVTISTVFLVLDHSLGHEDKPVLWETMIFGGETSRDTWRYTSRDAAITGHESIVELVRTGQLIQAHLGE